MTSSTSSSSGPPICLLLVYKYVHLLDHLFEKCLLVVASLPDLTIAHYTNGDTFFNAELVKTLSVRCFRMQASWIDVGGLL